MRKSQKKEILEMTATLYEAHEEVKNSIQSGNYMQAQGLLAQCQECAIGIGNVIEKTEGEGFITVHYIEEYCDALFGAYDELGGADGVNGNKIYKSLRKQLLKIENSVRNDVPIRKEIVFFPYKASMWDSLESVYLAAKEDPECDAYCVPIPYYDVNSDGSLGQMHYEGKDYPKNIEITDWEKYDLEKRRPDVAYIHNPYDGNNLVTRVHERFFSSNIKKYVDNLVYIPYFSSSGGMSEVRQMSPAYVYADYIVTQSESFRQFYDKRLPDKKFLPFGSPKFDRVIRICDNPPEPPASWKAKMEGKKVYFYNTSIGSMLSNTKAFLNKMEYVFKCFQGRKDACLLWRPHPLLESSFEAQRPQYKPIYDSLKKQFVESDWGIYDDTADVTNSIALSDAYISVPGSSVASLFGIAGKPLFMLNNNINSEPREDDWRGLVINIRSFADMFTGGLRDDFKWIITQGSKLYRSSNNDYSYRYFCDLSHYTGSVYYRSVLSIDGRYYACPNNAHSILKIGDDGVEKRIELKRGTEGEARFYGGAVCGNRLYLLPNQYPAIVSYDTLSGEVKYMNRHLDLIIQMTAGEKRLGAYITDKNKERLYIVSPNGKQALAIHGRTGKEEVLNINTKNSCGCAALSLDGEGNIWILPYDGTVITEWNPQSGEVHEYTNCPKEFKCTHPRYEFECMKNPFQSAAFYGGAVYLTPRWGNMCVRLDKKTGCMTEWNPFWNQPVAVKNGYYMTAVGVSFIKLSEEQDEGKYKIFSAPERKLYSIDFRTEECVEIPINFDMEELIANEPGFGEDSEGARYVCLENAFNSLTDFLDGNITGASFDKEMQIKSYGVIAENLDGTCGEKVHSFIKDL